MPIPDYETLMLPLLRITSDNQEHETKEVAEKLSDVFNLSPEQREERLPSGMKRTIYSRTHWARTYMKQAGLLESTVRGKYRITRRGRQVLAQNPTRIDNEFLSQFPEFREFRQRSHTPSAVQVGGDVGEPQTPEEQLDSGYQKSRDALAQELLERIKNSPPDFFEQLVIDLLVAMGYGGSRTDAGQAVGRSGDGGIDGFIKEDKLGLDIVYVQAKRWEGAVGRPTVQAFVGSLEGQRASKGVLITTSTFAEPAQRYVREIAKKIVLIDGQQLAQLMIDYGVGVTEIATYKIKKVDLDYFGEE